MRLLIRAGDQLSASYLSEKIPLFFLFFFVPSANFLDDCGGQETAGGKLLLVAVFMVVSYNSRLQPAAYCPSISIA
jgi:hypothetical protein